MTPKTSASKSMERVLRNAEADVTRVRERLAYEMRSLADRMLLLAGRLDKGDYCVNRLGEVQSGPEINRLCDEYELRKESLETLKFLAEEAGL